MNFTEGYRRQVVARGESIVAYLSTEMTASEDAHDSQKRGQEKHALFHEAIRVALKPLSGKCSVDWLLETVKVYREQCIWFLLATLQIFRKEN